MPFAGYALVVRRNLLTDDDDLRLWREYEPDPVAPESRRSREAPRLCGRPLQWHWEGGSQRLCSGTSANRLSSLSRRVSLASTGPQLLLTTQRVIPGSKDGDQGRKLLMRPVDLTLESREGAEDQIRAAMAQPSLASAALARCTLSSTDKAEDWLPTWMVSFVRARRTCTLPHPVFIRAERALFSSIGAAPIPVIIVSETQEELAYLSRRPGAALHVLPRPAYTVIGSVQRAVRCLGTSPEAVSGRTQRLPHTWMADDLPISCPRLSQPLQERFAWRS